ncbi:hypothetical protein [Brevundimonas sp.]|uniref:hypothetical protein n=1 Tax=Brevundimonas sp. TaxID=1871086 RepID=UPI003D6D12C0
MANLSQIEDPDALDNRYADKIIVYVEGEGDQRLFSRIVGPDVADRLEFKTPADTTGGCSFVVSRVKAERLTNDKIFGLVDGEAAANHGATDALLDCEGSLFALPAAAGLEGVIFLSGHELENVVLLHGEIYELIAKNVSLQSMGKADAADVRKTLLALTPRFFIAALMKYASLHVGLTVGASVSVKGGVFVDPKASTVTLVRELRQQVVGGGGDWGAYKAEIGRILRRLRDRFEAEAITGEGLSDHLIRLADGKNLLLRLRKIYAGVPKDGLLADALTRPPYADHFRAELLALTQAA